jgi:hypothetical protein
MIRAPKDFWPGLIFIEIGIAAVVLARSAYFPTILGGLLAAIGLVLLFRAFTGPGEALGGFAWKPLAYVTVSTVLFGVLVRPAGLAVALIVLTVLSARASRHFSWRAAIALAVGLTGGSVLVFGRALGLPMTTLGSWFGG